MLIDKYAILIKDHSEIKHCIDGLKHFNNKVFDAVQSEHKNESFRETFLLRLLETVASHTKPKDVLEILWNVEKNGYFYLLATIERRGKLYSFRVKAKVNCYLYGSTYEVVSSIKPSKSRSRIFDKNKSIYYSLLFPYSKYKHYNKNIFELEVLFENTADKKERELIRKKINTYQNCVGWCIGELHKILKKHKLEAF